MDHLTRRRLQASIRGDPEPGVAQCLLRIRLMPDRTPIRRGHGSRRAPCHEVLEGNHLKVAIQFL
jgi:hypothetical protein